MVKKADIPRHIVKTALALAATQGWRDTTLGDIADAAKLPIGELLAIYPSKLSIVAAYSRQIDGDMLKAIDPELASEPPRDRLFDVMMRRLDALAPNREAVRSIISATLCDPVSAVCGAFVLRRSMVMMLEAASIGAAGLPGIVKVKGLAAIYMSVLRVWLNDDSEDMAKTMSALDRALRRAECIIGLCRFPSRWKAEAEPEAGSA
ncbi:MAG: TetR family transcriptional regulator [Proteobacteria bacterium]|nr:TetR family transcriptional regulator [Pseudomonadota bacterium]